MKLNLAILLLVSIILITLVYTSFMKTTTIKEGLSSVPEPIIMTEKDFTQNSSDPKSLILNADGKEKISNYLNDIIDYISLNEIDMKNVKSQDIADYFEKGSKGNLPVNILISKFFADAPPTQTKKVISV
jgi:hypothetical protein